MVDSASRTLEGIERMLHERIGLDPSTVGSSLVHRAVHRRMAAVGETNVEVYATRIARDGVELQELVEQVVIPETYFFRESEAIDAVSRRVQDGVVDRGAHRPVRLLSAPCSSGEEPYSIAMALLSAGISSAEFSIDALDLSFEALKKANAGIYGRGSFRGRDHDWSPYFDQLPQGLSIRDTIRDRVRFVQANLLDAHFRAPTEAYDYVFCRNLLIYFDVPTQARVLATLTALLAPGGVLVVGASDTFAVRRANFVPVAGAERSFLFEHRAGLPVELASVPAGGRTPRSLRARGLARRPATTRASAPRKGGAKTVAPVDPTIRADSLMHAPETSPLGAEISRLANAGRLDEALHLAEGAAASATADAELLAIVGTTYAATHDVVRAEACYRRALYLDPSHAEALLHLALILEARRDVAGARRLRARARRGSDGGAGGPA